MTKQTTIDIHPVPDTKREVVTLLMKWKQEKQPNVESAQALNGMKVPRLSTPWNRPVLSWSATEVYNVNHIHDILIDYFILQAANLSPQEICGVVNEYNDRRIKTRKKKGKQVQSGTKMRLRPRHSSSTKKALRDWTPKYFSHYYSWLYNDDELEWDDQHIHDIPNDATPPPGYPGGENFRYRAAKLLSELRPTSVLWEEAEPEWKVLADEEEEEDDYNPEWDDEDDDDEEDEEFTRRELLVKLNKLAKKKPVKKKKPAKKTNLIIDEDDEDDLPPPKRKLPKRKLPKRKPAEKADDWGPPWETSKKNKPKKKTSKTKKPYRKHYRERYPVGRSGKKMKYVYVYYPKNVTRKQVDRLIRQIDAALPVFDR